MDTKFENETSIEQQFFKVSNETPQAVKLVITAFKKQDSLTGFAKTLAKKEGYPIWDKSQVQIRKRLPVYNFNGEAETQETYVFTPILQQDSSMLSGF